MINLLKTFFYTHGLALLIILLYFSIAVIKLQHPGVNNDQLMFVNAATFNPDNQFLWKSFRGFPLMVFPYIGALKSYFYMPIFYLFDVTIWSIRIPQLILFAISLFLLYKTLILASDKRIALLAILFLALDPSLIAHSRVDTGPIVIEFFLKVLAVYFLFLYLSTKRILFFFAIYPVLALGIFNKLNFIWFVNAFFLSFIVFYGKRFYEEFKNIDKFYPAVIVAVPYLFLVRFFIKLSKEVTANYKDYSGEIALSNISGNLRSFSESLTTIVNGNQFFADAYGYTPTTLGNYFSGLVFLIIFIGFGYLIKKYKTDNEALRPYAFFAGIAVLTAVQILLTKRATAPWHILSIYPFLTVVFAFGLFQIKNLIKKQNILPLFKLVILSLLSYQVAVNYLYISAYSQPTKSVALTSAIYDLTDYARNANTQFICLDVDICNQLLSLTQQTGKYKEPFGFLHPDTYAASFNRLADNFNNPDGFLYVTHGENNAHFPLLRSSFFEYIQKSGVNLEKIKEFYDGDTVVFEVYKVSASL